MATSMCRLCKFEVEMDDIALRFPSGACICVRCYSREVDDKHEMAASVRRDAERAADGK